MSSWEQVGAAASRPPAVGTAPTPRIGLAVRHRGIAATYAGAIFLSALLLFQVELIMGKLILPWFGGSAAVWTVTVLFFQVVLVLGYLYAHLLVRYVRPRRQMFVHVPILLATLLVLPILPAASWKPIGNHDPALRILGLLALTVGPPFLMLSTSGPLFQAWFARGDGRPYRLFAVSNGASLLGLLSYPLLIEPRLGTHVQAYAWSPLPYARESQTQARRAGLRQPLIKRGARIRTGVLTLPLPSPKTGLVAPGHQEHRPGSLTGRKCPYAFEIGTNPAAREQ